MMHQQLGEIYRGMVFGTSTDEEKVSCTTNCFYLQLEKSLLLRWASENSILQARVNELFIHTFNYVEEDQEEEDEDVNKAVENTAILEEAVGDRYVLEDRIGHGSFGKVYRVRDPQGQKWAMKVMMKTLGNTESIRREIMTLQSIKTYHHPNIVRIREVLDNEKCIKIVMDLAEGGTLCDLMREKRIPIKKGKRIFFDVVTGVHFLHSHYIVHGDLKPANIIIDHNGVAKLTDFGCSTTRESIHIHAIAGTLHYMAPEIIRGFPPSSHSDVWSLGVVLYEIAYNILPFQNNPLTAIEKALFDIPLNHVGEADRNNLIQIIRSCLKRDPGDRHETSYLLHHPWLCQKRKRKAIKGKVLLVNDEYFAHLKILKRMCFDVGKEYLEARSAQALDIFCRENVSVVFFLGEDGTEVAREMRKIGHHVPIYGINSLTSQEELMRVGAVLVWPKPVDRDVIISVLK